MLDGIFWVLVLGILSFLGIKLNSGVVSLMNLPALAVLRVIGLPTSDYS